MASAGMPLAPCHWTACGPASKPTPRSSSICCLTRVGLSSAHPSLQATRSRHPHLLRNPARAPAKARRRLQRGQTISRRSLPAFRQGPRQASVVARASTWPAAARRPRLGRRAPEICTAACVVAANNPPFPALRNPERCAYPNPCLNPMPT